MAALQGLTCPGLRESSKGMVMQAEGKPGGRGVTDLPLELRQ